MWVILNNLKIYNPHTFSLYTKSYFKGPNPHTKYYYETSSFDFIFTLITVRGYV